MTGVSTERICCGRDALAHPQGRDDFALLSLHCRFDLILDLLEELVIFAVGGRLCISQRSVSCERIAEWRRQEVNRGVIARGAGRPCSPEKERAAGTQAARAVKGLRTSCRENER